MKNQVMDGVWKSSRAVLQVNLGTKIKPSLQKGRNDGSWRGRILKRLGREKGKLFKSFIKWKVQEVRTRRRGKGIQPKPLTDIRHLLMK